MSKKTRNIGLVLFVVIVVGALIGMTLYYVDRPTYTTTDDLVSACTVGKERLGVENGFYVIETLGSQCQVLEEVRLCRKSIFTKVIETPNGYTCDSRFGELVNNLLEKVFDLYS